MVDKNAGTPETCAKKVLAAGAKCGKGEYMQYAQASGCYCHPSLGAVTTNAGHNIFKIEKVEYKAKQTPRLLISRRYCRTNKHLMYAPSLDACAAKVNATASCKGGNSIFTYDPKNKGWCSCCTNKHDAVTRTVMTRDVECRIYQAKNDRTFEAATLWNGRYFQGSQE